MQASAKTLLGLVEGVGSRDELSLAMSEVTKALGFQYFALTHHVDLLKVGGGAIRLHNYPGQWADHYDRQALSLSDPVHRASHVTAIGFQWAQIPFLIPLSRGDRVILAQGQNQGIGDGYTVPVNVPGEACGSCSFANDLGRPLPLDDLPFAQLVGAVAFEKARRLWLPRGVIDQIRRPVLTDRQRDCLLWAARGKTDWEISRILGISEETVARHIRMACDKYGVNKRLSVIVYAMTDGTITLSDIGFSFHTPFPE
ncbi:helix-turn-helix transcriptional regulator [Novosphingobium percolationis]|uniref:helix-turn-helix transcriptional regulator n=1 Tax=Novosphingobium percolationis TaxID=2871811 RepID=UPI00086AA318|nr:LuxR family transcriptional regulator [Novosphingobium percolationis]ODU67536.1 MAG: LuxR family transcriptional regulator [Novosphingobium sp. SCN 66-18]